MATTITGCKVYAYGVVRVSEEGGRSGRKTTRVIHRIPHVRSAGSRRQSKVDTFRSPEEQRQRIISAAHYQELEILQTFEEIDVSGRRPLARRKGLSAAVEGIEAGRAKVLIVAYFDRLMRDIDVKREVVRRVEAAGGTVFAVDFGAVSHVTAMQRLTSDMLAIHAEYISRSTGERLGGIQAAAIQEGLPIGTIPPGYRQDPETFRLVKHEEEAGVMHEAFEMRAAGTSWRAIQKYMAERGIVRSTNSVRKLLHSRTYLGELFHGKHSNPDSHEPIIDKATFDRVQRERGEAFKPVPGRKSPLLLAGLRILKCGTCGKSLAAAAQVRPGDKRYATYRCNPNLVCSRRVNIDAQIADAAVSNYVRSLLADESETRGSGQELVYARAEADTAQANYSRAQRNLALSSDEAETQRILAELKELRDQAGERVARLEQAARAIGDAVTLNAHAQWDDLTLDEQRALVRAVLVRVEVAPGGVVNGRRLPRGESRLRFVSVRDDLREALT
jgi:DNA invertase Pin-like site-specific DNA recombinase